ncbi:hypothetical protein EST38_g13103 [Candolleomyces aberdarensis]|uniref:Fungal lipase-type domain-containing protein n=1 Tax=Candolleomyces aberdarensis TaxID=2316362 RepID=A0A4Q2D1X8_9AGAR|nr:hypothetical protein EST38_g13103 [Candolleomyces aberdarensis]
MQVKIASLLLLFAQPATVAFAMAVNQTLEARQSVSAMSAAEVSSYKSYIWAQTSLPLITSLNLNFKPLRSSLFPGVSSFVLTHDGFGDAHAVFLPMLYSAPFAPGCRGRLICLRLKRTGGAIAIITTTHLSVQIPGVQLRTITFGSPRVGNQAFVNFTNARSVMNRINNKHDCIPILPGRSLNFAHTKGEIHIVNSNAWVSCTGQFSKRFSSHLDQHVSFLLPGQDDTNEQCTIGYVRSIFDGDREDHNGPYDGVILGNSGCS